MVKIGNHLLLKTLSVFLAISILFGAVPFTSVNTFALEEVQKGDVETLVNGGEVVADTVTFKNTTLEWSAADSSSRWTDGWWIGIKVTAPQGEGVDISNAKYQNQTADGWETEKLFSEYKDSDDSEEIQYISFWEILNEAYINDAIIDGKAYLEYGYRFDWDGDGNYENAQVVTVKVDLYSIKLKKSDELIYPKNSGLAEVDIITNGITASSNGGNIVVVENASDVRLNWVAKDETAGINDDGWWIGYNVVAPNYADISNAKYQDKTETGWDTVNTHSFDENKDTDNSIQVWRPLNETYLNNAVANNKSVNYITRYDWDADGVYEQIIYLKINADKIILISQNGEQIYPYLGTVTPLTGGNVIGNASKLELRIKETILNWSPIDKSVGRDTAGWWVGMKVTAPEGYTTDQLKNAVYKSRVTSSGGNDWSDYSSNNFWEQKDSEDDALSHNIEMWMVIDPSMLSTYENNGKEIKTEYVFDWEGDGIDDQTITLVVVPSEKIVCNKIPQSGFEFDILNPIDQWVGATFTNKAFGGEGTGDITYSITEGSDIAHIDEHTGEVTFEKPGRVTVTAMKAADDVYEEVFAVYTVKAVKYPQTGFKFENSNENITVDFSTGYFTNAACGGNGDGEIKYSIVSGEKFASVDEFTGKVTFIKSGIVVIAATKSSDNNYKEATISYTLNIEKSEQSELTFATSSQTVIEYKPQEQEIIFVEGGSGAGKLVYSIINGSEFATINEETGAVTTLKAGGSFTVEVYKAGDDGYDVSNAISIVIYVDYAEQSKEDFKFEIESPGKVTFNDNDNKFSNIASGGESTGKIAYMFDDAVSDEIADIDPDTGEVTIYAAGTITVCATKEGDDCYKSVSAKYSLTIEKDTPEFTVADVELFYGTEEYQINVVTILGSDNYIYSIEGVNNIGVSIDTNGKLTFDPSNGKVGSVDICVIREEDNQYEKAEKTFKLTVSYYTTSAQPIVIGEKENDSGWYIDSIVIKAPDEYEIAYYNELDTVWANEVSFAKEGINDAIVYLKNADGYITDGIAINDIKLDTENPDEDAISITYTTPTWEKVLETITFGIYRSETLLVKLTAKDVNSGIASLTYNIGGEDVIVDFDGESSVSHSFTINAQYRDDIVLIAADVAGRRTKITSDHRVVLDTKVPELNVEYEFLSGNHNEDNDIFYTQGNVDILFTIDEINFDISERPLITVNGQEIFAEWTRMSDTDKWQSEVHLSGNGDYIVKVSFTDVATNKMIDFEQVINIDNNAPEFDVKFECAVEAKNENNYNAERIATIKITEHNFKADEVVLNVIAEDITGADVDISSKHYEDYAKNRDNWKYISAEGELVSDITQAVNADEHYLVLPVFDIDAIYTIRLEYTDLTEKEATTYETEFVIDKTIANSNDVMIEYSDSIVDKILNDITFGFYQEKVQIKVTVKDQTSGVEYFEITYNPDNGKNNSNKESYTTEKLFAVQDENDKNVFTANHTISAQARGSVSVNLIDKAGNATVKNDKYVIVTDTIAPGLEYEWTFTDNQVREYNNIFYTQKETKVKFTISESNFDLSLIQATGPAGQEENAAPAPVLTVNEIAQNVTWTQIDGTDKWETEIVFSDNGDYVVELSYTDRSENSMEKYKKEVHIDDSLPVFDVTFDNNDAKNENNYNAERTATIKVTEHNFNAEEVVLNVTAKDICGDNVEGYTYFDGENGDKYVKEFYEYAKNSSNWKYMNVNGELVSDVSQAVNLDEHYLVIPVFDIDAIYSVTLEYTDLAENEADSYEITFVIDKTAPTNIKIEYSSYIKSWQKLLEAVTLGYYSYKDEVMVTVTADDLVAGVDFFTWSYTQEENTSGVNKSDGKTIISKENITYSDDGKIATASFTIDAQSRGYVSVVVTDKAGNSSDKADNTRINVVDNIAPTRTIEFSEARVLDRATMTDVDTYVEGQDVILYYENEAVVTITINEANFYSEDVVVILTSNGVDSIPVVSWTDVSADIHIGTFTISGDGDYFVKVSYVDRSNNAMVEYGIQNKSPEIRIDNTDPSVDVEYTSEAEAVNGKYYKEDVKAVITIVDHNFLADNVDAKVTAKDVQGNDITNAEDICAEYAAYLKDRNNWTTYDGEVHTAEIIFNNDAQYTLEIDYKDIVGNDAETYVAAPVVVDHEAPTSIKIDYSESIVDKFIEAITFGFYKSAVKVTITADDITSGVDFFECTYTKETDASDKNTAELKEIIKIEADDELTATAEFTVPANVRGYITVTVVDRADNSADKTDKDNITVIVDNIVPEVSVEYIKDNTDTKVQFTDDNNVTVDSFAEATHAYYNGDVTVKIIINEANFFEGVEAADGVIHNVGIKLTKTDDDDRITVYEYLPSGAVQKYDGAIPKYITWTTFGDYHSFNINYSDNADYVLEVEYTDLSANDANISADDGNTSTKSYKSKIVTVDKIAPVVDVKYSNENIIHTIDGRKYFAAEQIATITVQEHNFRADDFVTTVISTDILENNVNVENFKETLSDDSKWIKNGNVYTITIKYSVDANYSFDYEYEDLAQNAGSEYEADMFTVDTTAPDNLTVSYSQSVSDRILEAVTFGYYNSKVTVTITAEDDTSGIHRFEYAYIKSKGVSSVNAQLLKAAIEEADFEVNGNKFIATFEIPKDVLQSDNQFNGTVEFTAFDRSENSTEKADTRRVIVDNIAPTATITYSAPVQIANDISYYAGNIDAKIVINEANFYSEDVIVKVNDEVVSVKWTNDSVDVHTGTFTLTEDGDYVVTVEYKDRSANEMTKYKSDRLTLDTVAPTVKVTNIKQNSANKDDTYSFVITANDINLDAAAFKPILTAIVRKSDGSYAIKNISLGDMSTVEIGKTYTFTVDNLEDDAAYSLVCTLKDMSGNAYSKITLEDGKEYEEVRFSINRNGSVFAVDEKTDALVNQYYVYNVNDDVVIEEINVDPVEIYVVKLNGETLTEGTDYTSDLSEKEGEWSKRTYTISKELFTAEGEYNIVVESTDKTDTTSYSDVKNLNVSFVVDRTAPILTISGLENGGRYQVEEQTVTVIPTDDGGRLYSIKVIVLDSDGNPLKNAEGGDISVRFEMSGDEFTNYLTENNGKISFTVPEGLENQVQIICNDCSVNSEGETNEYNVISTKVTVSQSGLIIFYANKPLFYGCITGVILLTGGIILLLTKKKTKKEAK